MCNLTQTVNLIVPVVYEGYFIIVNELNVQVEINNQNVDLILL